MKTMRTFIKKYDLLVYFILANLLSWAVGISLAMETQGKGNSLIPFSLHYLYAFGPALGAIITAGLVGGCDGIRDLFARVLKCWTLPIFSLLRGSNYFYR